MPVPVITDAKPSRIVQPAITPQPGEKEQAQCKCNSSIVYVQSQITTHWTSYLMALSTPIIAVIGAVIAYQQWLTSRNKLKLDLFEKRHLIFEATRKVIGEAARRGKPKDEDLFPFLAAIAGAKWLFNQEIEDYLRKKLWGQLIDLQTLSEELELVPDSASQADRIAISQRRLKVQKQLFSQFEELEKKLGPFLQLSH